MAGVRFSHEDRERRERIMENPKILQKQVRRARVILELGSRQRLGETVWRTGMSKPRDWRWRGGWGWPSPLCPAS